jgi:hypothetical protein
MPKYTTFVEVVAALKQLGFDVANYEGFPVDEFNLYAINEQTNEPEVLIDGLHECMSFYLDV